MLEYCLTWLSASADLW